MNQNTLHTTKHYSCMHVWFVFVKCRLISKTSNNTGSLRTFILEMVNSKTFLWQKITAENMSHIECIAP